MLTHLGGRPLLQHADRIGMELTSLVTDLCYASPPFAAFWNDHSVLEREGGTRTFNHPEDGLLQYEQLTLSPTVRSDYKLVILMGPKPHKLCETR